MKYQIHLVEKMSPQQVFLAYVHMPNNCLLRKGHSYSSTLMFEREPSFQNQATHQAEKASTNRFIVSLVCYMYSNSPPPPPAGREEDREEKGKMATRRLHRSTTQSHVGRFWCHLLVCPGAGYFCVTISDGDMSSFLLRLS